MSSSHDRVVKYYDDKGSTYDDYSKQLWSNVYDAITWKIAEPYIPKNPSALVFDAAGGTGKWSIPIAKCGPKVVLGDISEGMLKVAKEKIDREGLQERIEIKECDLRNLDFEDQNFDLVFCEHALCFIKEQEAVIKELVRVLKNGHPLIITCQSRYVLSLSIVQEDANYAFRVLSKETQFIMRDSLRVYALSPDEFRQMLEKNGVKIERIAGKLFTMPLGLSWQRMASEDYTKEDFQEIMNIELELTNRPDTVSLGAHLQAIGHKRLH
jgi:ubiquinone/menaquinone biosynthesis C-methylase UbiE